MTDNPLATPDWFPMKIDTERNAILFVQMTRDTFRQSSFLHNAIVRAGNKTMKGPVEALARLKPSVPSQFILHTAFCGSTLLARYLEAMPRNFVLKEPVILNQLCVLPYNDSWPGLFTTCLKLLGRAYPSDVVTIIKLHDVCNWMAGPILDYDPRTKIVYLYNPLRVHLLQILKNQRRQQVHGHVRSMPMMLMPRLSEAVAGELSDAQCAAAMWLLNAHLYNRLLARSDAHRVLAMNGEQVIVDPQGAVLAVAEFFGLADAEIRAWVGEMRSATTHSHSVGAGRSYDAEARAVELAEVERRCGEEADAGMAWAHGICPELVSHSPFETSR